MSKVKATFTGFAGVDGVPVLLTEGDEYDSEHPLVQARPDLFSKTQPAAKTESTKTEPPKRGRPSGPRSKSTDG